MKPAVFVAVAALALLPLTSRAAPITEPIVFDFEDGLQGWELFGLAQRVETRLLGGEWAIFGDTPDLPPDDPAVDTIRMRLQIEPALTGVASLTLDYLPQALGSVPPSALIVHRIGGILKIGNRGFKSLPGNPPPRVMDLGGIGELILILLHWGDQFGGGYVGSGGFIDNIVLHPVPEPSTLALLGFAVAGLGLRRRRRAECMT